MARDTMPQVATRYTAIRMMERAFRWLLAGLLAVALLAITPTGITAEAHAEMSHDNFDKTCLSDCINNSLGQQPVSSNQQPEEEQNKDPKHQEQPYYLQFSCFYEPQELISQTNEAGLVLRPPDLIKLCAAYRD